MAIAHHCIHGADSLVVSGIVSAIIILIVNKNDTRKQYAVVGVGCTIYSGVAFGICSFYCIPSCICIMQGVFSSPPSTLSRKNR
jgi:hypothetical protein